MPHNSNFHRHAIIDTTPLPEDVPQVKEIGATSAPLLSAAYYIGDRCRAYNDDYMVCKTEAYGKGEFECMKEGRKVTRCAASVIADINEHCLKEFRLHWRCLETQNHQLWQCRRPERRLNQCVYEKIGLKKEIPDSPEGEIPIHLRQKQIFSDLPQHEPGHPDAPGAPRFVQGALLRMYDRRMRANEKRAEENSQQELNKAES